MTSRNASESRRSPSAVEPSRSENTIVTVLRTSCAGSGAASGAPQKPQRRNRSGFSSPQFGQVITSPLRFLLDRAALRGHHEPDLEEALAPDLAGPCVGLEAQVHRTRVVPRARCEFNLGCPGSSRQVRITAPRLTGSDPSPARGT